MTLQLQEQLNEAFAELKQSQAREAKLTAENSAILSAISSITSADDKQQIFQELKSVLSLYVDFSHFLVVTRNRENQEFYQTILSTTTMFDLVRWAHQSKFERALSGECIILYDTNSITELAIPSAQANSALITGVKGAITDSIIIMLGERAGHFSLEVRDTLSRFRPLLERALIDIERTEQLQRLVDKRTRQLKLAQLKAERANEAKSRFLAMMSHELRTPLNAVLGYIDVLQGELQQSEHLNIVSRMEASSELLLVLMNDILDLSTIESGNFSIKNDWVRLRSELEVTLSHFYALADAKSLKLQANLKLLDEQTVWVDPVRIMQIVFNLVGNAIKFTTHGNVCLEVDLIGCELHITVSDTGIGIEASRLNVIFGQFKQADDSITRRYGGSGLGLAITKQLVTMMGGQIDVESKLNVGSKFSVRIPVSIKSTDSDGARPIAEIENTRSYSILVVEDTKTNQMVLKLLLEKMNHRVKIVSNGLESVEYLQTNIGEIDVIFMDLSMPVMDGLTATKEIRKFCKTTPIIALTARAMEQDKQSCLNSGMNAFVSKPIRSKEIKRSIETVLN